MIAYCYSKELEASADCLPSNIGRSSLTHRLASAYRLLAHKDLAVLASRPATRTELLNYHTGPYLDVLLEQNKHELIDQNLADFGLEYDCPVFDAMTEYVQYVAGASIEAARVLSRPNSEVQIAVNWDGGRHHAKKGAASGFCYVQDIVLAIQELRKTMSRVLYIDLDLHHGDGVESAFVHSDRVYTLSLHRHDPGFFPNTGAFEECGRGKGKGYSLNVPLRRGLSDSSLQLLIDEVVVPVMKAYIDGAASHGIVVQCGLDSLALDPCKEWNISIDGYCAAIRNIQDVANQLNTKVLYLGGGGYNKTLASRCYASILATLLNVELGDIPEHSLWHEYTDTNHERSAHQVITSMVDENKANLAQLITKIRPRMEMIRRSTLSTTTKSLDARTTTAAIEAVSEFESGMTGPIEESLWTASNLLDNKGQLHVPTGRKTNIIIMMHGFGDNSDSFFKLGKSFNLPETVVIALEGPHQTPFMQEESQNSCMWADDVNFNASGQVQDEGNFAKSEHLISQLVDSLRQLDVPSERITFFGYGQGGMVSLKMAARHHTNVIAVGTTMPDSESNVNSGRNALICGGSQASKVTRESLSKVHAHFESTSHLQWKQSGDGLPKASKYNSWLPVMKFLSRNIVQMAGIPDGAIQL